MFELCDFSGPTNSLLIINSQAGKHLNLVHEYSGNVQDV